MTDDIRPRWFRLAPLARVLLVVIVVVLVAAGFVAAVHLSRAGHRAWYGDA